MLDFAVIGAGIGGIYFTHEKLVKKYSYRIFDKNDYVGGRLLMKKFHGTNLNMGAGVIMPSDKYLIRLIDRLGLKLNEFTSTMEHPIPITPDEINNINNQIKNIYLQNIDQINLLDYNFLQFMNIYFPNDFVDKFFKLADYGDFRYASVKAVIEEYPIEKIIRQHQNTMYSIADGGWYKLLKVLLMKINLENIQLSTEIVSISKQNNIFELVDSNQNKYMAQRVVISGDITIRNIKFIGIDSIDKYLGQFDSVPFLRIYTYHQKINLNTSLKTFGILSKIIKINSNILMSTYSDSENAVVLYDLYLKLQKEKFIEVFYKLLTKELDEFGYSVSDILDIEIKFWENGVHCYNTLHKISQDDLIKQGICFCGEMVSNYQGWTEGVIQTVDNF